MKNHGTTCTTGQLGEIGGNIMRALPNALKMLEAKGIVFPKKVVGLSQQGEHLSCALAVMFKMLYNGNADVAALLVEHYSDRDVDLPTAVRSS